MRMTRLKKRMAQQVWVLHKEIPEPPTVLKTNLPCSSKATFAYRQQHQHLHGSLNTLLLYQPGGKIFCFVRPLPVFSIPIHDH